jgi:hypothetical protein
VIGGGWHELLQHRTPSGGEERRGIWAENPGGGAHHEATTAAARQAARSGRGMDASADERSKVRGGAARGGSARKKRRRGRNGRGGVG